MSVDSSNQLFEKLKLFTNYTNDCIYFKYIFNEDDIICDESKKSIGNDELTFHPEFTHQIFGDDENIFGYKNLKIQYYLTPATLDAYIGLKYDEKISPQRYDGIEPDDFYHLFTEFGCSPNFTKSLDTFKTKMLKADAEFKPFGEKVYEYKRNKSELKSTIVNLNRNQEQSTFEIYRVDSSSPCYFDEKFVSYIERVQTMLVYFIETASFVDTDDPQWTFYILYEKFDNGRYATIGYLSAYNYYAYPDKTRTRISQIMTFPKYQGMGHGAEMITCLFRDVCSNSKIIDVTAESPSLEFIHLRDYVTTKMCLTLPIFKDKDQLFKGFNSTMAAEALKTFKLPKSQTRRCYEIIRMAATDRNNINDWTQYRLDIKKRFYLPFIRRSKCARNAGGTSSSNDDQIETIAESKAPVTTVDPTTNKRKTQKVKLTAMDSRFSGNLGKLNENDEEEEEEDGVTTIGFGKPPPSKMRRFGAAEPIGSSTTTIGFGSSSSSSSNGIKKNTVTFGTVSNISSNGINKPSSLNSSDNTNEDDASDSSENNENSNVNNQENLFMSEADRKKYLEEQFQESIKGYAKVLKRLESNY
jgi:histone acetyltransferase 1